MNNFVKIQENLKSIASFTTLIYCQIKKNFYAKFDSRSLILNSSHKCQQTFSIFLPIKVDHETQDDSLKSLKMLTSM